MIPVSFSFKDINDFVNAPDVEFEDLQYALLSMAAHFDKSRHSAEITLFKKPNDPNERVNKPNYNPPSFEDFDK